MDHVVYLDASAKELESLLAGKKTMIIRGAAGRKLPYGRVGIGDCLYLLNNNAEGIVKARATVASVFNSEAMPDEESVKLVSDHQGQLQLTEKQVKRWAGKRYMVLIGVDQVEEIAPFRIDKSNYGNMDDWLPVGNIKDVRV